MIDGGKSTENKFSINILGQELTVTGEKLSEDYVEELALHINKIAREIKHAYPQLPRRRLVGLTLINLADKYMTLNTKYNQSQKNNRKLEEENKRLKEKINSLQKDYEELSILLEEVDD